MKQYEVNTFDELCNIIQSIHKKKTEHYGIEDMLIIVGKFYPLFKGRICWIKNI